MNRARQVFGIVRADEIERIPVVLDSLIAIQGTDEGIPQLFEAIRELVGLKSEMEIPRLLRRIVALLQALPLGVITIHRREGIIAANDRARQILRAGDDILGMTKEEFCRRYGLCPGGEDFLNSLEYTDYPLTFSHHFDDGRVADVYLVSVPESDEIMILLDDVTEISQEREWFRCILGAIGDAIIVLDREKKIVWTNDVAREWFKDRGIEGPAHCYSLWTGAKEPCPNCPMDKIFEGKKVIRYTERVVDESGEERFYDVIAAPVLSPNGEVTQIVQIARDTTEMERMISELMNARRNLEEMNKKLEQQYLTLKTLSEISDTLQRTNSLDRILHIVLTAVTAREGLGFNRAFMLLVNEQEGVLEGKYAIGPSSPEEAGRIWAELSHEPRTLSETLEVYQEAVGKGDSLVSQLVKKFRIPLDSQHFLIEVLKSGRSYHIKPDNPEVWDKAKEVAEILGYHEFVAVPLISMTKPVGVLIVDNMITGKEIAPEEIELLKSIANHASLAIERSSLTEQLRRSYQKLEEAYTTLRENQQKLVEAEKLSTIGAMAAQVAHEIRNPLVTIGGFTRRLLKSIPEDDEKHRKLKIILQETERLEQIVDDVLSYARISSHKFTLGDINRVIREALVLFEPEFEDKNIKVETELADDIPQFMFDESQTKQVFINLIRNSLSVLGKGGKITIKTRRERNYCWIEFSDNGPGVPPELGDKIFQPFFTTKSSGTGLGLAISSRIIEAHKGAIWYKNNPAGGVTFYIRLPIRTSRD